MKKNKEMKDAKTTTKYYERFCKNIPDGYIQNKTYDAFLYTEGSCGKGKYFVDLDQACHAWMVVGVDAFLQKKLWNKQFWRDAYRKYLSKERSDTLIKKNDQEYKKYKRGFFKNLDKDILDCYNMKIVCPICNKGGVVNEL